MSLSHSRDQERGGSAAPAEDASSPGHGPSHSPETPPSFTSFPGGEGATDPDIPAEPMLNKIYNKVLSLTSAAKSPVPPTVAAPVPDTAEANSGGLETTTGLGISLGTAHQSKSPSLASFGAVETGSVTSNHGTTLEKTESNPSRPLKKQVEKSPIVLEPVVSTINAIGGLTRSEDEVSNAGSEKGALETSKHAKTRQREINLPGLASFRLTREPSSDSESISSYSAHPARTVKSIIGRLKTGDLGREFWMKDETSHECFLCGEKFTTFRRKHHCRICGRIFDDKCTSHVPGARFGHQEKIRVCNSCKNIMDEYDGLEGQENGDALIQQSTVSLNIVPPSELQSEALTSSGADSPQVTYTMPAARRPGTVPQMAIPATRTAIGTSGRHTAVEIPALDPAPLSRPQSSRSNTGIQIGRRRSQSFNTQLGGRPRSDSMQLDEAHSRAPFHQNINDDELLSHDVSGEGEDAMEVSFADESYAPISASRDGTLDNAPIDASQQDHLKLPSAIQRHRSISKATLEDRLRTSKRRSLQNIQRRSRSKSRSHRMSHSITGDYLRGNDLAPPSPSGTLSYPQSVPPSSPVNVVGDLNQSSILHVQKLLTQMLRDEQIENVETWQRALMPILLKIADTLDPDVRSMGDDIDVRSYVKIKRLPGGTELDSTYVSGVVFTKNLPLKKMPRTVSNPRIMLLTFPVEYHHNEMQLMSFDPMIAQGKEYIHNLVMRIVSHKPSVLVVGNSVSGIALDLLLEYGIATLINVKPSVIEALSRCCEADIISSIDKLSSNPELGTCGQFSVRTSVHDMIPGQRKTLVYLNGCPEELGCTVVLRGAGMQTLSRIKRILDFMIYVVYNLKLETSLMYDNMINMPSLPDETEELNTKETIRGGETNSDSTVYDNLLHEFRDIILSASPCVRFPPPELLVKARNAEIMANKLRKDHEDAKELLTRACVVEDPTESVPTAESSDPEKAAHESQEPIPAPSTESPQLTYQQKVDALLHEYRHARATQELNLRHRQWENFKLQSPELMNPLAHQNIIVLYSNLQKRTSVPCQGPDIHVIDYYSETDCSIGQYVEDLFLHKEVPCDECEKMQHEHVRNYVHNHGRMNVFIEKFPCPLPGMQQSVLMWSWCSLCELTLNVSRMSENSYRYSFGKWLELAFYAKDLKHRGGSCPHDVNLYHVRYFGYDNWVVRFQYDTVDVLSLVVPDMRLTWEPEGDVHLKYEEKASIAAKVNRFFDSVGDRWKSISMDNIATEKQEICKTEITQYMEEAQSQRELSLKTLDKIWDESMVLDRLPLNRVLKDLQDSVVYWDTQFGEFEKLYLPSDRDIRRLTQMQLRKLVGDSGLPFMDVLERKSSATTPEMATSDGKQTDAEQCEKGKGDDGASEAGEKVEDGPLSTQEASKPIDVPPGRKEETSPSIMPSSADSRMSEISETDPERRILSGPKTLTVAPKIARLQAEIISPAATPMRQISRTSVPVPPGSSTSPPQTRSRNLSAQSSESEEGNSPTDSRKGATLRPANLPASKIPKPKPLTSIHHKTKSGDSSSETRHKSRNPSEDTTDRKKPHKQFMSNTIKKLQRIGGTSQSVYNLTKHFDELNRQYEKEEIKRRKRFGYRRAFPVTSAKPKVEVFSNVQDAVHDASDDDLGPDMEMSSVGHSRTSTMKGSEDLPTEVVRDQQASRDQRGSDRASVRSAESDTQKSERPAEADITDIVTSPAEVVGEVVSDLANTQGPSIVLPSEDVPAGVAAEESKESVSIMRAITNLWADRSAALWKPLEYPLQPSAHMFSDSDVIVREDEPSSLIAFTLSSQDYQFKLQTIKDAEPVKQPTFTNTPDLSKPPSRDGELSIAASDIDASSANDIEAALLRPTGTHMKYQFQEGSANFFCKIFYAEQFDALRINCGCDEHYIQSLSRCLKWDSSGGKSKSAFLKTLDDRLVVKQMSRYEMDAFVKFAPSYFEYMSQAFFHELPTVLAKILGFYQIGSKNPVTGKTMKMDVLVMENLFYNRKTTRIFDLKGSMRNRHVQSTGKANEVLLDENLVEFIYESPLFVGQHSKRMLRHSLWNDTLFLAKMNVMDYSLVIGIDEEHKDLVLGIIDFIRTFTWDKKLESWVKERGFVGGGTKEPTIVTPRQYKNRYPLWYPLAKNSFRASMERYFLQVPNCFSIHDIRRN